ncbi:hypothetical protein ACT3TS_04830 [Specibacter sp. AOP5-B1-6]|uniref:hypothetical protein n=1 Tax=Specibacter sp. AOP5-B1-6 TaxID=3457653 RepID=UPI00402BB334
MPLSRVEAAFPALSRRFAFTNWQMVQPRRPASGAPRIETAADAVSAAKNSISCSLELTERPRPAGSAHFGVD